MLLILVSALLYSSVGHAGASAYLASMALVGVAPASMKPTALVLNILVATIATVQFARAGCFSWRLFLPFAVGAIPLSFVGGAWQLPGTLYKQIVGAVLVFAAARLALGSPPSTDETRGPAWPLAVGIGAMLGLLAGLTGTGGGIFLTPLLLIMRWADARRAAGVSAAFILVNSISGLAGNMISVRLLPSSLPWLALAAVVGGAVGSYLGSRRIVPSIMRRLLAVVLLIAGGKLIAGL